MHTAGAEATDRLAVRATAVPDEVPELRRAAAAFAERHGIARPGDVALAVGEAVANAVVHAYRDGDAGPVRLTGTCEKSDVTFVVEDEGSGLAPRADSPGLGAGFGLIAALAERFAISSRRGGGTTVRMAFGIQRQSADSR